MRFLLHLLRALISYVQFLLVRSKSFALDQQDDLNVFENDRGTKSKYISVCRCPKSYIFGKGSYMLTLKKFINNKTASLREDVSYFPCFTHKAKEIGDVCLRGLACAH